MRSSSGVGLDDVEIMETLEEGRDPFPHPTVVLDEGNSGPIPRRLRGACQVSNRVGLPSEGAPVASAPQSGSLLIYESRSTTSRSRSRWARTSAMKF